MIDEYEAYEAYATMVKMEAMANHFAASMTIDENDLNLIEVVSRMMMSVSTSN